MNLENGFAYIQALNRSTLAALDGILRGSTPRRRIDDPQAAAERRNRILSQIDELLATLDAHLRRLKDLL